MFWEPLIWEKIHDQKNPNMLQQMPARLWENIRYDRFRKIDNFCMDEHQMVLVSYKLICLLHDYF